MVRAAEGLLGYKLAFEFQLVVFLLDLHRPNAIGEEVLLQLRLHPERSHIPIVIVTGLNEEGM